MQHYNVCGISGRRVNPDDGTVEYRVQWEGYDSPCDSWEPRSNLITSCAGPVGEVDASEETAALQRIASWAVKRGKRSKHARDDVASGPDAVPPLHGIIVHSRTANSSSDNNNNNEGGDEGEDVASLMALGERVLTNATSRGLNATKRGKKIQSPVECVASCDPALSLEKCWRDQHAVSFMHSCVSATSCTPAAVEFELGACSDTCRDASNIEIYSIAPAALVKSGHIYESVASCEPLIGKREAENLRNKCKFNSGIAHRSQALLRGRRDQLVVRYFLTESNGEQNRTLLTMPLSVFRRYYPQLLLDFLLHHALVMESS